MHIAKNKKDTKVARYVTSGMVPQDELVVALAFANGFLHDDFMQLLGDICTEAATDFDALVASTRNCVLWGQGAAVVAAFRTAEEIARCGRWANQ